MFLKNKWKNLSIKKKLFLWSSLTIIIAFSLLYISMYLFMPKVYELYKVNNINEEIKELKYELLNNEEIDIDEVLDKFSYENNLDILLVKKDGNNLINEVIYSSFREGANSPNKIPFLGNHVSYVEFNRFQQYNININKNEDIDVVIRPEDIEITTPDKGMLTGKVNSVIFKGVHYEMEVITEDTTWIVHNIKHAEAGKIVGLIIDPESIHIMRKVKGYEKEK